MKDPACTRGPATNVWSGCLLPRATFALGPIALAFLSACATHPRPDLAAIASDWKGPTTQSLSKPVYDSDVFAVCAPPVGWTADPLKKTDDHAHQVWRSPSSETAYGIIYFKMPLPVGSHIALSEFIKKMKKTEGEAILENQEDDPNLPGIRFVADGGLYQIRTNLIVDGWEGWAVYAGTLRAHPINQDELDMAVAAREHTRVGHPESPGK